MSAPLPSDVTLSALALAIGQFCHDVGRIASALETLALIQGGDTPGARDSAAAFSQTAGSQDNMVATAFYAGSSAGVAAEQAAAAEAAKPKRTRRTKEQIAADEAALQAQSGAATNAVAAVLGNAPVTPPAPALFPAPTAPVGAAHGAMAAGFNPAAPFAAPSAPVSTVATQPPATVSPAMAGFEAQYSALTVEQQFASLLDMFVKHGNLLGVREALVNSLAPLGIGMPLSDPLNHNNPGVQYQGLSNAGRWSIYAAVYAAAQAAAQAAQPAAM